MVKLVDTQSSEAVPLGVEVRLLSCAQCSYLNICTLITYKDYIFFGVMWGVVSAETYLLVITNIILYHNLIFGEIEKEIRFAL